MKIKNNDTIEKAVEAKVAVITFSNMLKVKSPCIAICGRLQSNNEVNNFGDVSMESAHNAAIKVEDTILLNASVDCASCESLWCRKMVINYLKGISNCTRSIDSNHNLEDCCYQLICRSCGAVIGICIIDLWLLKMAGISWELILVRIF